MDLPHDFARCPGGNCPSRSRCLRYTRRDTAGATAPWAAMDMRREAGASACDQFLPAAPVSTFRGSEA
ncbi:MAG: hypothetical protein H3C26_20270 [Rhodocyclaceae bacterium]|nr:hypothetical protein [Rhodocyclaceae bacterium]